MKWVAITLLLLNGVFLAIQLNKQEKAVSVIERFPFSGPLLKRVSEQQARDNVTQFADKNRPPQPVQAPAAKQASPSEPAIPPFPQPVPAARPTSNAMACYRVGPFLLIGDLRSVLQLLESGDIVVQERSETLRKQAGYWVYIPPLDSLQQAREALRQMEDNGVSDVLIISEGSKANAISTGVYKTEELGRERRESLGELGFQAKIEPLFRSQSQYWLELELMKSTQIPEKLWREVTAGYPNIQQLRRKCE